MTDADRVFEAVAAPARRRIVELLAVSGAQPVAAIVTALSERHPMSQPAISQHLKVLRDAGVVIAVADGRRRLHSIDRAGLDAAMAWLAAVRSADAPLAPFEQPLDALATEVARGRRGRGAGPGRSQGQGRRPEHGQDQEPSRRREQSA